MISPPFFDLYYTPHDKDSQLAFFSFSFHTFSRRRMYEVERYEKENFLSYYSKRICSSDRSRYAGLDIANARSRDCWDYGACSKRSYGIHSSTYFWISCRSKPFDRQRTFREEFSNSLYRNISGSQTGSFYHTIFMDILSHNSSLDR